MIKPTIISIGLSLVYLLLVCVFTYFLASNLGLYWVAVLPLISSVVLFVVQAKRSMRYIIDFVVVDRFEVKTIKGAMIVGSEIRLLNGATLIILDGDVTHYVNINSVKYVDWITKANGRDRLSPKKFLDRFPK